jgi:hypothetical protein
MKISLNNPPLSLREMCEAQFPLQGKCPVWTFGKTIYNPHKKDIPEDIFFHESVHSERQDNPANWWERYLSNAQFRYEEELVAYAAQYAFIKRHYPFKAHKEALFDLANNLASMYNLDIPIPIAESTIRLTAKDMVK